MPKGVRLQKSLAMGYSGKQARMGSKDSEDYACGGMVKNKKQEMFKRGAKPMEKKK